MSHELMLRAQVEDAFQSLNLAFCELASLLMLSSDAHDALPAHTAQSLHPMSKRAAAKSAHILPIHLRRVREYVTAALRGEASVTSNIPSALARSITPSVYATLLPTIWALICNDTSEHSDSEDVVLTAVVDHSIKLSSNSAVKRYTIDFIGRIILVSVIHYAYIARADEYRSWRVRLIPDHPGPPINR